MISFFVATALAFAVCMFVIGHDIGDQHHPAAQRAPFNPLPLQLQGAVHP